jgi:rubredoxin
MGRWRSGIAPASQAGGRGFESRPVHLTQGGMVMAKWKCTVCGWVYDEEKEGKKFEELPDDYKCPVCGAPKSVFEKIS